ARALPILAQKPLAQGALGDYTVYYEGLAELRLGRPADAKRTFEMLAAKPPVGFLAEGAALRQAECEEALGDHSAAVEIYERVAATKPTTPDEVLRRLAREAKASGNTDKAAAAYARVLYEFPFSDSAATAAEQLDGLPLAPIVFGSPRYKLELGRAERLFGA